MYTNHVTLNGKTITYSNSQVLVAGKVVYVGVVNMAVLVKVAYGVKA